MTDDNPYQPATVASPVSKYRGEGSFTLFFVKLARLAGPVLAAVAALGNLAYQMVGEKPVDWPTSFLLAILVFAFFAAIFTVVLIVVGGAVGFILDIVLRVLVSHEKGDDPGGR